MRRVVIFTGVSRMTTSMKRKHRDRVVRRYANANSLRTSPFPDHIPWLRTVHKLMHLCRVLCSQWPRNAHRERFLQHGGRPRALCQPDPVDSLLRARDGECKGYACSNMAKFLHRTPCLRCLTCALLAVQLRRPLCVSDQPQL
jgi:hypothetical protein